MASCSKGNAHAADSENNTRTSSRLILPCLTLTWLTLRVRTVCIYVRNFAMPGRNCHIHDVLLSYRYFAPKLGDSLLRGSACCLFQNLLTAGLAVQTQYGRVMDRQTDRHVATAKTALTRCVARVKISKLLYGATYWHARYNPGNLTRSKIAIPEGGIWG